MNLTNYAMEAMMNQLEPYLERADVIGYAAARNVRKLRDGCQEYLTKKQELVMKYGTEAMDEDGNPTGQWSIKQGQEGYEQAAEILETLANFEDEVELFKLPMEKAIGLLSGKEILSLGFMFEEDEDDAQ